MTTTIVVMHPDDLAALPLAAHMAAQLGRELTVLCVTESSSKLIAECKADDETDQSELVKSAFVAIENAGLSSATVIDCRGPRVARAVLNAIAQVEAREVILCVPLTEKRDARYTRAVHVFRACPTDVLALDIDSVEPQPPTRILVPQVAGGGANGLLWAARAVGGKDTTIVALPDPKHVNRSRRVFTRATERITASKRARFTQLQPTSGAMLTSVQNAIADHDLVLFDAEQARRIKSQLGAIRDLHQSRDGTPFTLALVRPAGAAGPGAFERGVERLRVHVPKLTRDERKSLYERIEAGGKISTDFVVMLMLSATIAALGLVQSSAAVVIGAMLVAPLMTPLVAMGMALVQANVHLFHRALRAMVAGVFGGLVVSFMVGALSPWDDLSAEVVARGSPNLFDLGVALLSGVAAAYALARPGLAGTLVGVAIAVALVPPLAAVGISLSHHEYAIALGAAVLFTTNFLAITFGAALVFQFFGLGPTFGAGESPRWVRIVLGMLVIGIVMTTAPLIHNLNVQTQRGALRPYARPLPRELRQELRHTVDAVPGVEILLMAHSDIEHGFGVEIVLLCDGEVDPTLVNRIETLVDRRMGHVMPTRVLLVKSESTSSSAAEQTE